MMVGAGWAILAWRKAQLEGWGQVLWTELPRIKVGDKVQPGSPADLYLREFAKAEKEIRQEWFKRCLSGYLDRCFHQAYNEANRDRLSGITRGSE